ncbi:MAG TPA: tRNA (cytidine(34)-2'-O)-methyltransferase [Steroidobacteraceae bacterium]
MFHVILLQPQIPQNAGNIIRLCANSGCCLHLIRPCTFDLSHKGVRRAGLDYAELTQVFLHDNLAVCIATLPGARVFSVETDGARVYSDGAFRPGDAFLFGSESDGLPAAVIAAIDPERRLRIPMRSGNRSLNLGNAVALIVYEAWRQNGFM